MGLQGPPDISESLIHLSWHHRLSFSFSHRKLCKVAWSDLQLIIPDLSSAHLKVLRNSEGDIQYKGDLSIRIAAF